MYYFGQINPKHSVPQIMDKLKTKRIRKALLRVVNNQFS